MFWNLSPKTLALMEDWENAEINRLAGLETPRYVMALAFRVQKAFVKDLAGDLNEEWRKASALLTKGTTDE